MAGRYDFIIRQGSRYRLKFTIGKETDAKTVDPVDLTGVVIRSQLRRTRRSNNPILDLGTNGYIQITDAISGEITITIPAEVTKQLNFRAGAYYDIEIEFPDGTIERVLEGIAKLSLETTIEA